MEIETTDRQLKRNKSGEKVIQHDGGLSDIQQGNRDSSNWILMEDN